MDKKSKYILPLIVFSQFAGTSLWFVGNAILPDIRLQLNLGNTALGNITSIVQFGFIAGTLVFALLAIADRFSPSKVFFVSSLVAAAANLCIVWLVKDAAGLMTFRFITGFFLAGIYPVGMKIASDWYEKGLGKALGYLVGALVLGTAFPHLLKGSAYHFSWQKIILFTSLFASLGGLLIVLFVHDGPFRKQGQEFHPKKLANIFRSKDFRAAAFGYFGHMWELYTFWAFVPVMLAINISSNASNINVSLWSFIIIAAGSLSCVAGGYISQKSGSAKVAFYSLLISGICCLLSFLLLKSSTTIFLLFMLLWGIAVIADSPQFSALVAQTAPPESKGTALTFVTSIGFAITIGSIQLLNWVLHNVDFTNKVFIILSIGPAFGLVSLYRLVKKRNG
ncbi:MAG: nitrate/nitrite transporter [Chitinophagales bacterium]